MKINVFKYIFFSVVLILMLISIYMGYTSNSHNLDIIEDKKEKINIQNDITIGIANYDTINPILSKNKDVQYISKLIFDSLIEINQEFKLQYNLAEECSKIDKQIYIIKLKENIQWHDDITFTAEDVKFTIDELKNDKSESIYQEQVKEIDRIEIINDYMLKIYLKREIPFFEYMLNFPILPSHIYEEDGLNPKNECVIGTGKYRITYLSNKKIKLKKRIQNDENKIENININIYNSYVELYTEFSKENVDLITTNNINYEKYIGTIGYGLNNNAGREFDYLVINTKSKQLANSKIRKAISYAINRQRINYNVYNNKYHVAYFPIENNWLYNKNVENEYNLNKAKELLNNTKIKNEKISLNLLVNTEKEKRKEVANELKEQLQAIDIEVNIKEVNKNALEQYIQNNNYDLILTGNILSTTPDLTTFFGENNLSNFENEEILNILKNINNISDENNLIKQYKKIIEIYNEEMPFISLYFDANLILYNTCIKGNMEHNWYNIFYNIKDWYKIE